MEQRTLGVAGPVSAVGLGCMGMSGAYGPTDRDEAVATIHAALDAGVTLLDTGDFYAMGHNELLVAEALRGRDRDGVLLSVKFGGMRSPGGGFLGFDGRPEAVKNFLAYSLVRLGTDHVDIYRPARLDPSVPIEETVGAIGECIDAGWVRHLGLSEVGADTVRRAHAVRPVADVQLEYSLMSRSLEDKVLPTTRELGIAVTAYGALSRGLLVGQLVARPDRGPDRLPQPQPALPGARTCRTTWPWSTPCEAVADARASTSPRSPSPGSSAAVTTSSRSSERGRRPSWTGCCERWGWSCPGPSCPPSRPPCPPARWPAGATTSGPCPASTRSAEGHSAYRPRHVRRAGGGVGSLHDRNLAGGRLLAGRRLPGRHPQPGRGARGIAGGHRESELNAVCHVDADAARAQAVAADVSLPFGGVPIGVKELEPVDGWPFTEASLVFADRVSSFDSTQVTRLRAAGAVVAAQTTASEFGGVNCTSTKLHGTTRNPWDTARTPGGSSGGSAAAVAGGLLPIAIGRRRWRLDPNPGRVHRAVRPEGHLRPHPPGAGHPAATAHRHGRAACPVRCATPPDGSTSATGSTPATT